MTNDPNPKPITSEETGKKLLAKFRAEIAQVCRAERQITKALPQLIKAAESNKLRNALKDYLQETKGHVSSLEKVLTSFDTGIKSKAAKQGNRASRPRRR